MGEIKLQVMALISETGVHDLRKHGQVHCIGVHEGATMKKLVTLEDAEAAIREKDAEIERLRGMMDHSFGGQQFVVYGTLKSVSELQATLGRYYERAERAEAQRDELLDCLRSIESMEAGERSLKALARSAIDAAMKEGK